MCLNCQLVFCVSIILYRYFPIVLTYVSFLLVKINIRISLVSISSIDRDLFSFSCAHILLRMFRKLG